MSVRNAGRDSRGKATHLISVGNTPTEEVNEQQETVAHRIRRIDEEIVTARRQNDRNRIEDLVDLRTRLECELPLRKREFLYLDRVRRGAALGLKVQKFLGMTPKPCVRSVYGFSKTSRGVSCQTSNG